MGFLGDFRGGTIFGVICALFFTGTVLGVGNIDLIYQHPEGAANYLQGRVWGQSPGDKVAVYIRVAGGWWIKPDGLNRKTDIDGGGLWSCDVNNQPNDHLATEWAAFLVPGAYTPPLAGGAGSLGAGLFAYPYVTTTNPWNEPAWLEFTFVPQYGGSEDLEGKVFGVTPSDHKVLVYINVSGWYAKPTWATRYTSINPDGTWQCDITTAGSDLDAVEVAAFLVPNAYTVSDGTGEGYLDSAHFTHPYARGLRDVIGSTLSFAGHSFSVKESTGKVGPGPNYFSSDASDVWVDGSGKLHLTIHQNAGKWYCTEVIAEAPGYGTYVFTTESNVDLLDENIIVGMFVWDTFAPQYVYREIDFEFSTWGDPANPNSQFVIQPWDNIGNRHQFDIDYTGGTTTTTHVLTWRSDELYFKSYYGQFSLAPDEGDIINSWYYSGADLPPAGGSETVRINFYLMNGSVPVNGLDAEIVVTDFQFLTDISDRPGDIDDDDEVSLGDFTTLSSRWEDSGCDAFDRWCNEADQTCDGFVNVADIQRMTWYWMSGI